jgi:hypothetical protein
VPLVDLDRHGGLKNLVRNRAVRTLVPGPLARRSEATLRRELAEVADSRYAESNRITAELTGLDLARYGYTV